MAKHPSERWQPRRSGLHRVSEGPLPEGGSIACISSRTDSKTSEKGFSLRSVTAYRPYEKRKKAYVRIGRRAVGSLPSERKRETRGSSCIWLTQQDNSFDANLLALKSLQGRLREIAKMDPTSFQYQAAMQQITAQEQGEANAMIHVFVGCWFLTHHPLLWGWIQAILIALPISMILVGIIILTLE